VVTLWFSLGWREAEHTDSGGDYRDDGRTYHRVGSPLGLCSLFSGPPKPYLVNWRAGQALNPDNRGMRFPAFGNLPFRVRLNLSSRVGALPTTALHLMPYRHGTVK
jgi:hypothetical protein